MRKTRVGILASLLTITSSLLMITHSVLAISGYSDYQKCLDESGGRGDIPSVQWACRTSVENNTNNPSIAFNNICSLWIGNADNSNVDTIYVDEPSGLATIAFWGMCTEMENTTARIWLENDNGAIYSGNNLTRGTWAKPKSLLTTLDVDKFLEGLTPYSTSEGQVYTRENIEVFRCHGGNESSCSSQTQSITVIVRNPKTVYYSSSNASASGSAAGGTNQNVSTGTGIHNSYTQRVTGEINLRVGDKLDSMKFHHDVFASMPEEDVGWKVCRTVSGALNKNGFNNMVSYYTMQLDSSTSSAPYQYCIEDTTDITDAYSSSEGAEYISVTSPQNDDRYKNIYFRIAGVYKFCETIYVDGTALTSACVQVNVGAKTNFRAESNVTCVSWYQTTGIQAVRKTVTDECSISVNETIPVIFSHNAYATQASDNVAWRVTRNSGLGTGMAGSGYSISYPKGSGESANGTEALVIRTTNMTTAHSSGLFIADTRPYTDGLSYFVHRDYYSIKFTVAGIYNLCETITVGGATLTTSCARIVVEGGGPNAGDCAEWAPASFTNSGVTSGTTSIKSAVKNEDAGYNSWAVSNGVNESAFAANAVYAKPGDTVSWAHCYYPGVQTAASTIVTKDNSHPHPTTLTGNINYLDNAAISSFGTWDNYFNVSQSNMLSANAYSSGALGIGNASAKKWENTYEVETGSRSRAGLTLTEQGTTSAPTVVSIGAPEWHSWECNEHDCGYDYDACSSTDEAGNCIEYTTEHQSEVCHETCNHDQNYISNSRTNTTASDKAMVKVPYNFVNTVSVSLKETAIQGQSGTGKFAYAGETVTVDTARVTVSPRYNSVTKGTYATKVNGAEVRLLTYTSKTNDTSAAIADYGSYNSDLCSAISGRVSYGNCAKADTYGANRAGKLNSTENVNGKSEDKFKGSAYNVYDIPAGEYFCVVAAVYPYTVSSNTEMNKNGSNSWYISAPDCFPVAKKPSLQVWGASLYTAKNVITSVEAKNNIHGFYNYAGKAKTNLTLFGSWVEQSVVVPNGRVSGLASGAATGYYSSNGNTRTPTEGLGGSKEGTSASYCNRVPLTLSNFNCTSAMQQAGGYATATTAKPKARTSYIDRFRRDENVADSDDGVIYVKTGDYTIGETTVPKGETRVIESTGTVTITGDILYEDGYSALGEIPKLILYAKNITIECSVSRVDAVLIAEEDVNTCPTTDINARDNSNQLVIHGTVITNTLTANRTYGAATGANSVVPAEIIDYDSTLYLWGNSQSDKNPSGKLNVSYQHELSPRY